ncbi:hypothetical protein THAOC_37824 [Thalassiosira oceanica]|uniref:Uncharacterized protein n=1 Tax=Thalassiosira oceanica TaxID=159749 RepID=K0QYF0_THAOC|nr:hypothetical protein THAOC_37824 [Thalassiosira oceanica]|eukprot:EJK43705.1 hypothetical protein THAOC_37824 [Thalassiosira oceanica]
MDLTFPIVAIVVGVYWMLWGLQFRSEAAAQAQAQGGRTTTGSNGTGDAEGDDVETGVLAKALDGKGQNWQTSQPNIGMTMSPTGEADKSTPSARPAQRRKNDGRESRAPPWPPLEETGWFRISEICGPDRKACGPAAIRLRSGPQDGFKSQFNFCGPDRKACGPAAVRLRSGPHDLHAVRTTTRFEPKGESSSSMASPGGPTTAPMAPIHPQYIPYEVLRPKGYSDGSTADVIYQTSRCNSKIVHHQTSPACRGLGAVDNVTSIETGSY